MKAQNKRVLRYFGAGAFLFFSPCFFAYADKLSLSIIGTIESRCEINFSDGRKIDLTGVKERRLPFDVYCNQPMIINIKSKNGGLKQQENKNISAVNYLLNLNIEKADIEALATSVDLASGQSFNGSRVIPFSASGQMTITLKENLLYAGSYSDIIAIDVFPSIHNVSK